MIMQDTAPKPRKPILGNRLFGVILFSVAAFMFISIIYRSSIGF